MATTFYAATACIGYSFFLVPRCSWDDGVKTKAAGAGYACQGDEDKGLDGRRAPMLRIRR